MHAPAGDQTAVHRLRLRLSVSISNVLALRHSKLLRTRRLGLAFFTLYSLARWSLDFISAVFLAVVVVFVQAAPTPGLGCGWATLEVFFFLWYSRRLNRLNASGSNGSDSALDSAVAQGLGVFRRLLDEREGAMHLLQQYPHHIQDWFVGSHEGAPVGVRNVADLLDHLLLQGQAKKVLSTAEGAEDGLLHSLASSLWTRLGREVVDDAQQGGDAAVAASSAEAYAAGATPISPQDKPLMACYRPLLFYLLMEAIAGWSHVCLTLRLGFTRAAITPTATYYVKQGRKPNRPPIVFLHGIGIGLAPYLGFLSRLAARTGRTIIAVQYKHVSMRMTHHVPSAGEVAADVEAFLTAHHFGAASIVGHSYGTLVASSMVKTYPKRVAGLTLLDPVCFAMFLPHLLRNSLFFHVGKGSRAAGSAAAEAVPGAKKGRWGNPLKGVVVRDVHVAAALSRNSHWADVNLWVTDLPMHAPTTVVMSGADHLVPVEEVQGMLSTGVAAERGVRVEVHLGRGHGAFVLDPTMQDSIIQGLGGCSEAVHTARQRGAAAVRRRSLDMLADCAAALTSLVQSLHESVLGEQDSEAALRMLAPGLASRARARAIAAVRGGARVWVNQRATTAAKYTVAESAASPRCSGGGAVEMMMTEQDGGSRLMSGARASARMGVAGRSGTQGYAACSGGRSKSSGGEYGGRGAMSARAGGMGYGTGAVGARGGMRRPVLQRPLRPLQRLSPVLLRACSGLLTPRRTCIQGVAGIRGGVRSMAQQARGLVRNARALLRMPGVPVR